MKRFILVKTVKKQLIQIEKCVGSLCIKLIECMVIRVHEHVSSRHCKTLSRIQVLYTAQFSTQGNATWQSASDRMLIMRAP